MEISPLIPIGSKIKVDKSKIEKLLSSKLMIDLPEIIIGEVMDYKMTDGMDIGYVIMTENNIELWIFKNELNEQTIFEYKLKDDSRSININFSELIPEKYKFNYNINGNKKIKIILNPINLIRWLLFTLKDTF